MHKHVQIHRHVPRNFAFGRQKAEKVLVFSLARPAEGLQNAPQPQGEHANLSETVR